jgi:hypothetical protein
VKKLTIETRWHVIDAITGMIRVKHWTKLKVKGEYDERTGEKRVHGMYHRRLRLDRRGVR